MAYQTKQQQAVLRCLQERAEECLSAADLSEDLRQSGLTVGLATVYRQLDKLTQQGLVHKVTTEEGALYLVSLYGEDEDAFELKLRPVFSLSDEDIEESMELYGITYDDFFASEGIVVCPNEEVFHTATVLKDSNAVFALLDWESDEPWNEHILLTAEKFLAYMRMMEEDGNSLLASVTTLSGMVTGLEQLYVP